MNLYVILDISLDKETDRKNARKQVPNGIYLFIYLFLCFPKRILFKICLRIIFVINSWYMTN